MRKGRTRDCECLVAGSPLCLIYSSLPGLATLVFKDLCIAFHYLIIPSLRTPPHDVGVGRQDPHLCPVGPGHTRGSGLLSQKVVPSRSSRNFGKFVLGISEQDGLQLAEEVLRLCERFFLAGEGFFFFSCHPEGFTSLAA